MKSWKLLQNKIKPHNFKKVLIWFGTISGLLNRRSNNLNYLDSPNLRPRSLRLEKSYKFEE